MTDELPPHPLIERRSAFSLYREAALERTVSLAIRPVFGPYHPRFRPHSRAIRKKPFSATLMSS